MLRPQSLNLRVHLLDARTISAGSNLAKCAARIHEILLRRFTAFVLAQIAACKVLCQVVCHWHATRTRRVLCHLGPFAIGTPPSLADDFSGQNSLVLYL